ncbi:hypothetical protein LMIY3S_05842 [Labrys miyagiensis]
MERVAWTFPAPYGEEIEGGGGLLDGERPIRHDPHPLTFPTGEKGMADVVPEIPMFEPVAGIRCRCK